MLRKLFLNALEAMTGDMRRTILSDVGLGALVDFGRAEIAAALREAPAHSDIRVKVAAFVAESTAASVLGRGLAIAGKAGAASTMLASGAVAAAAVSSPRSGWCSVRWRWPGPPIASPSHVSSK